MTIHNVYREKKKKKWTNLLFDNSNIKKIKSDDKVQKSTIARILLSTPYLHFLFFFIVQLLLHTVIKDTSKFFNTFLRDTNREWLLNLVLIVTVLNCRRDYQRTI